MKKKWFLINKDTPKDVLLLLSNNKWAPSVHLGKPVPVKVGGYWEGGWHVFGASWKPTHWQYLPDGPDVERVKEYTDA